MNRLKIFSSALNLFLFLVIGSEALHAQQKTVYMIEITDEVDLGMSSYVRRVLSEAHEENAAAVMLHVNTFGGRVDVATEIRDAVMNSRVPVVAFVDKRAISAGALITIAAPKIAMVPGGTIGAATPVDQTGQKASEKVVSYMRSEMRSTAEHNGRDPGIAEAMVDESIALADSSYKRQGQLLSLTTEEAVKLGYCDAVAPTAEEALRAFGYGDVRIIETDYSWGESLVRFLTNPIMSSILIMLGLGGIFYAVKTGHVGSLAGVGIASIALFFGAQYLTDLATFVEVLMFIAGVALIVLEIFVIPGFGIAGISGAVLVVASLFLALVGNLDLLSSDSITAPLYTLAASFIGLTILVVLMFRYLPKSSAFNRFVLNTTPTAATGFVSVPDYRELVGSQGAALTTLRPAGVAQLGAERYDVITEGEYIHAGEQVKVVTVEGRRIVVRRV